ncbi:hypothetical protein AU467_35245 [Mesorhizobium loti]|uniref:Uncharacterized protein n=1 Tax=Rhizobium loti TaxID=381 RepID=A0A101KVV9_RHILI|nr:hypothetical protein AU467_35245 [Mesorhizobium loti]
MTISTQSSAEPAANPAANAVRAFLGNRRALLILGAVVLGLGLVFKWNWVVAAGIAPFLLAVLPCVAMCALGLCMSRMVGGSGNVQPPSSDSGSMPPESLPLIASSGDPSETQAASGASAEPVRAADKSCCHH